MPDRERLKLFNKLCKTCSRHRVLPKSMHIPDCWETSVQVARGGFADVSQGTHQGRQVAIKVVRMCLMDDPDVTFRVSLLFYSHRRTCIVEWIVEVLPRGSRLEAPPASKCPTIAWSDGK
jgi:hypothetical protein